MQTLYREWFAGDAVNHFEECRLGDICELLNGRAYNQKELLYEGKYRVLRVGNFFTQSNWYYSDLELEPDKYCDNDDLLICWSASFGAYIWNGGKVIYHYHIWKVDFSKSHPCYREFLYLLLCDELERMKREGHGSVMAHLTKAGVENMPIPQVDMETAVQFSQLVRPSIELIKANNSEIVKLTTLQRLLLGNLGR